MSYTGPVLPIVFLLKVSRPRFWLYILGPYLIGLAAGVQGGGLYQWKILLFGLYFLFPANLLIYGVNDIFDYETDRLNEKKTGYEVLVAPSYRLKLFLYILILNLPFIIGSFFLGITAIWAMAGFLFFSCFYSAPPIRAKTKPFLDSIFNVLYIFPGIFAFSMLNGDFPPWPIVAAGGVWTMAMHAYSAVPDIEADSAAGLRTIATTLGAATTLVLCLALYLVSAALVFQYLGALSVILGAVYTGVMLFSLRTARIFQVYKYFPLINSVSGFLIFWYVVYLRQF